ncbi:MAG: hypothetical protein M5U26_08125 [Planctomycetota bacterium]|nr:hypothetical protein [Planctomycetota bacterium]
MEGAAARRRDGQDAARAQRSLQKQRAEAPRGLLGVFRLGALPQLAAQLALERRQEQLLQRGLEDLFEFRREQRLRLDRQPFAEQSLELLLRVREAHLQLALGLAAQNGEHARGARAADRLGVRTEGRVARTGQVGAFARGRHEPPFGMEQLPGRGAESGVEGKAFGQDRAGAGERLGGLLYVLFGGEERRGERVGVLGLRFLLQENLGQGFQALFARQRGRGLLGPGAKGR